MDNQVNYRTISLQDLKHDFRSFIHYFGSKETQFTAIMGSVLLGLILSLILPIPTEVLISITMIIFAALEAIHFFARKSRRKKEVEQVETGKQTRAPASNTEVWTDIGFLIYTLALGSVFFIGLITTEIEIIPSPRLTWGLYLRFVIVVVLLWGFKYCQYKLDYYKELYKITLNLLNELETIERHDHMRYVRGWSVVFSRYREDVLPRLPWVKRKLTFLISDTPDDPSYQQHDEVFHCEVDQLRKLELGIPPNEKECEMDHP